MAQEETNINTNESGKQSVSNAIADAVTQVEKNLETGSESTSSEKVEEIKSEAKKDDDPDGLTSEQIQQSRQLYLALKDPEKAPVLLRFFAEQAGYEKKIDSKEDTKEVKDEILTALEEHLGEEFSFLSGKLSKALDKIIKSKFDEHSKEIKQTLEQQAYEKLSNESVHAYTDLSKTYFGKEELPDNVSKKMSTLMDRYKPGQGVSVKDYLNDIFHMAASQLDINLKTAKNSDRINKSRGDAISRLASSGGSESSVSDHSKTNNNKPASIADAIRLAKEQLEESSK
jgi:hypothetical protein